MIVVLADDQGFGQLPVYSADYPDEMLFLTKNTERYACDEQKAMVAAKACMPHLNKLAANGVTFMNAHVTSPVCGPSRAALMTGRYQQRFGAYDNWDVSKMGVPLSETMLPELFQKAGYRTAMIGKWHLGRTIKTPLPVQTHDYHRNAIAGCAPEHNPINRGFDHYFGFNSSGTTYYNSPSLFRGTEHVKAEGYLTDEFTDDAVRFIEHAGGEPFFIYLAYSAPHIPLEDPAPKQYQRFDTGNSEVDNYYAYIAAIDDGLGKIVSTLETEGELKNTLIFYLSDNGAVVESPQPMNGPFRGNKGSFHHGGMHVPMIAHWPAGLKPVRFEPRVSALDVLPTALAAAGIGLPPNLDGVDLLPHIESNTEPHEALYWAGPEIMHWDFVNAAFWHDYNEYLSERSDDLPRSSLMAGEASWAVQKGKWLLRRNEVTGTTELFDLDEDPGARSELSARHPEVVERLTKDYREWAAGLQEPLLWSMEEYRRLMK
ncbi:sulfatase family protein [Pontiella desulfatans]|uniref:sulfatase family protein n=1 Tax=Pontiella desulfatans TaxID=2750659 RepID=UPI001443CAC3|nr:sulfatase-like hydrolase/transferase [Pontiella desulfatans]